MINYKDEGLINPFADYTKTIDADISAQLSGTIIDRARPIKAKPGYLAKETKLKGLHFLEVSSDEGPKKSYLVGDALLETIFSRETSPD